MSLEAIELDSAPNATASIIVLHGLGADGNDFVPVAHELELAAVGPVRFVFPHAPTRPVTINGGYVMRAWYDILGLDSHQQREDEAGLRESQALVEGADRASEKARGVAGATDRPRRLQPGLRDDADDRPAPRRAPRRPGRPLGLPAAGGQGRGRTARRPTATRRSSWPTARVDPVIPIARARQSRDALLALGHPVEWHEYAMPHSVCAAGDRRPQSLAAARCSPPEAASTAISGARPWRRASASCDDRRRSSRRRLGAAPPARIFGIAADHRAGIERRRGDRGGHDHDTNKRVVEEGTKPELAHDVSPSGVAATAPATAPL